MPKVLLMPTKILKLGLLTGIFSQLGYHGGRYIGGSGIHSLGNSNIPWSSIDDASFTIRPHPFPQSDSDDVVKTSSQKVTDSSVFNYSVLGQKAVGFPFMAHGGLLASLVIMQQVSDFRSRLVIKYLHATMIGRVLRFEAMDRNDDLNVRVYSSYANPPLIEACTTDI